MIMLIKYFEHILKFFDRGSLVKIPLNQSITKGQRQQVGDVLLTRI
jgi:hypothetical protein